MVLRHKGYGVYVTCDGRSLEEFDFQVENDTTVSCYIASEQGKAFVVHWVDDMLPENDLPTSGGPSKSVSFFMDGNPMAAHHSGYGHSALCDGSPAGNTTVRPFQFASIMTTDDDGLASRYDLKHENLGLIEVRFRRTFPGPVPTVQYSAAYDHSDPGLVHERSKKAGSHRVGLGEGQLQLLHFVQPTYFDAESYVVFRFRYRSRAILQAQGIIPQPPQPSTSNHVKRERDDDEVVVISDSDDDTVEMERKVKLLQDRISRKRAKKNTCEVKTEPDFTGDIIDLT